MAETVESIRRLPMSESELDIEFPLECADRLELVGETDRAMALLVRLSVKDAPKVLVLRLWLSGGGGETSLRRPRGWRRRITGEGGGEVESGDSGRGGGQ